MITGIHRVTQMDLPVVLVGAGLPQLPGLAGDAKSYAERLFDFPFIGELDEKDAQDAIRIPAERKGVQFTDAALRLIVRMASGYPYFLQEWGYHSWNAADRSPIDPARFVLLTTRSCGNSIRIFFSYASIDLLRQRRGIYVRWRNWGPAHIGLAISRPSSM